MSPPRSWREASSRASRVTASISVDGREHVVAHRREHLARPPGRGLGGLRLLAEGGDPLARRRALDHAGAARLGERHVQRRDRHAGAGRDVLADHLLGIHAVDVVGAEHADVVGPLVVDEVEALVDRVGRAGEPARAAPLLRRHRRDVVAEQRRQAPGRRHVPVEAVALVLRQHGDLEIAGVDEVREREVDEPVVAAERHRGLGAVERQRQQALALAARQHDPEDAWHRHVPTLLAERLREQALDRGHGDRAANRGAPRARGAARRRPSRARRSRAAAGRRPRRPG